MSELILPSYPGFAFERKRNPQFDTRIQTTARGQRELRANFDAFPVWHFAVPIGVLVNDLEIEELNELLGFYLAVGGRAESWLYDCPNYNTVNSVWLGNGNGSKLEFQLRRIHPYGFIEPVHNPDLTTITLFLAGEQVASNAVTVSATGLVTFNSAPDADVKVTWSGHYYYRCRFDGDLPDFTESANGEFSSEEFSFMGSPVNLL